MYDFDADKSPLSMKRLSSNMNWNCLERRLSLKQLQMQRAVSHSAPGSREEYLEAVDLSTTKFKGRVILGIGEKRISHDDSESSSNSEKSHQNPYMEYRLTMKAKSKSSQNGPSAKESGELIDGD